MIKNYLFFLYLGLVFLVLTERNLHGLVTWQTETQEFGFPVFGDNRRHLNLKHDDSFIAFRDESFKKSYYQRENSKNSTTVRIHPESSLPKRGNLRVTTTTSHDNNIVNTPEEECPEVIRNKVGLFDKTRSNSSRKEDFEDTILLVASNYAYYNMLQNWEFLAHELNLQWAVLALDDKLYDELGPSRAIPPDQKFSVSGAHHWGQGNFKGITCNKIRMALDVAKTCKVDVVFTDADHIFFKNPFEHDFGRLIKSKRFDYLYQPNHPSSEPRVDRCLHGSPRKEANTGFYYFGHKSSVYQRIAESTLERCQDPRNKLDDQSTFWKEFWKVKGQLTGNDSRKSHDSPGFQHCGLSEYENPEDLLPRADSFEGNATRFSYCCIDPFFYPIGDHRKRTGPSNKDPITYHANYARSYGRKVEKLVYARSDGYGWNQSRFIDGNGGLLE